MPRYWVLGLTVLVGCSDRSRPITWTVTDSAQVSIVTSEPVAPVRWQLGEASLRLGTVSGGQTLSSGRGSC